MSEYMEKNMEIIIEQYVNFFRNLLITLLKDKTCCRVDESKDIKNKKKYNYCLHPNYKGKECKRMVRNPGDLCVFHKKNDGTNKGLSDYNSLDENNYSLNESLNKINKSKKDNGKKNILIKQIEEKNNTQYNVLNNKYIHNKSDNSEHISPEKIELLDTINAENDKLTCNECKKTLVTPQEINRNICNLCFDFPLISRNKTLIKCKTCNKNTININGICNRCFYISKNNNIIIDNTICSYCNSLKQQNQKMCRTCYKKQKRKIKIFV